MLLSVIRRAFWFAVLGMAAVVLSGPILAIVGILLPFALIGALVWLAWWGLGRCRDLALVVRRRSGWARQPAEEVLQQGLLHCRQAGSAVRERGRWLGVKVATFTRAAKRTTVEVTCAALLGALVAWWAVGTSGTALALGALAGALLGLLAPACSWASGATSSRSVEARS
jgi:hypothetical protein